ncbi:peptidoglycan editing factor PgeF [Woodsholea maritima]|uniref:peptidoglycan editing factor PgeF n=1 Tax=Woodsholea maritima TaxID=240237 RepID=UPI00038077D0|nr:peptidoglycan editing factor PgeF [Woodsholea maritima]
MSALHLIETPDWADLPIRHGFTTRLGGVSLGPYQGLNLSWSRGDDKAHITENRARVTRALGVERLVFANQIHSATVLKVDHAPTDVWSVGEGDALITDRPGLGLCAQTADCVPILLYDHKNHACAAIHSGWRGTVANIIAATITAMGAAYGTRAAGLHASIGPAITKAHYRVGPEVLEQFEALFGSLDDTLIGAKDEAGGAGLAVSEACRRQLIEAGICADKLHHHDLCTYARGDWFFSCRRAGAHGHPGQFGGQCAIIALDKR